MSSSSISYPLNAQLKKVGDAVRILEVINGVAVATISTRAVALCKDRDYCWINQVEYVFGRAVYAPEHMALVHLPTGQQVYMLHYSKHHGRGRYFKRVNRKLLTYFRNIINSIDHFIPELTASAVQNKVETYHDGRGNIIEVTSS